VLHLSEVPRDLFGDDLASLPRLPLEQDRAMVFKLVSAPRTVGAGSTATTNAKADPGCEVGRRLSGRMLTPLPPDPARHQDSAIAPAKFISSTLQFGTLLRMHKKTLSSGTENCLFLESATFARFRTGLHVDTNVIWRH
jgi:hypothetical protein